jgi:hypothetical protein
MSVGRFRTWAAGALFGLALRIDPPRDQGGPRCPDCRIGPALPDGEECPYCREEWERQRHDDDVYDAGREHGRREAEEMA